MHCPNCQLGSFDPDRVRIWGYKVFVDMMKPAGGTAIYMFDLPEGAR